jgi:hypothetical protein
VSLLQIFDIEGNWGEGERMEGRIQNETKPAIGMSRKLLDINPKWRWGRVGEGSEETVDENERETGPVGNNEQTDRTLVRIRPGKGGNLKKPPRWLFQQGPIGLNWNYFWLVEVA